jgi:hypothetical protein
MGGAASRPVPENGYHDTEDSEDLCSNCFLFSPKVLRVKSDPIGTPLPPTPPFVKRKQEKQQWKPQRDGPLMSSRYGGLEKESASSGRSFGENGSNGRGASAEVHEGPVSERIVFL